MPVNPKTLQSMRVNAGLSKAALAQVANVDRRTIARIEAGMIPSDEVRALTARKLADALKVTPDQLAREPSDGETREQKLHEAGYEPLKFYFDAQTLASFDLVEQRYKIPVRMQIGLAPLFSTMLAEMSLAKRRERLARMRAAFKDTIALVPRCLQTAEVAHNDFEGACRCEEESIAAKDLFGARLLEITEEVNSREPFDPNETNPFVNFIRDELAVLEEQTGEEVASPSYPDTAGLPRAPAVLDEYLRREVCAGSQRACQAVQEGRARLRDVPPELWGRDKSAERAAWLEAKYPAEKWAQQEAELRKLIGTVNEAIEAPEAPHA